MLISVVMDPLCLTPEALGCAEARFGAETLLEGVIENGVLVARNRDEYVRTLAAAVGGLGSRTGQCVQGLVTEIVKSPRRFIAGDRCRRLASASLRDTAATLRADIVVCRNPEDVRSLSDLRTNGIEVCTLAEYRSSRTEVNRKEWFQELRLDTLATDRRQELVGRALRYATEILVVDRYVAGAAKEGWVNGRLKRFVRGMVYLAECWGEHSPYAGSGAPTIHLLSVAGGMGASSGFVDPGKADGAIRTAFERVDLRGSVGRLQISLKLDRNPPITNDRFIAGMRRCFGVHHGIDDFGNLSEREFNGRPTSLAPDCQHHRDILAAILDLERA